MEKILKSDVANLNRWHEEFKDFGQQALDRAMKSGEVLARIKRSLPHGQWLPWIRANLNYTDQTARRYMAVYENRDKLKSNTVLNLTGAYKLLAPPKLKLDNENEDIAHDTMDIRDILPNPHFDMGWLVASSIQHWVNVLTREDGLGLGLYWITAISKVGDKYQNICDHNRYYAIQKVGIKEVPVTVVKRMDDAGMKKATEIWDKEYIYDKYMEALPDILADEWGEKVETH